MMSLMTQFGAEATASTDIMTGLGVHWGALIFQIIAFAILVFILSKWVFPVFFKIIDKRQETIEASNRAAIEASKHAEKAQEETDKLLKQARTEAASIVATAKEEATAMVADAEAKSQESAERIVAAAHDDIAKEVLAAKKALHNETIELVAEATEKVIGKSVNAGVDNKVIKSTLEELK